MGDIARAATARQPISQQNMIGGKVTASVMPFLIILLLTSLGTTIFIYSAWIMILFSTMMTIFALYYSLIKRTILLCKMRRKLKKGAAQNLGHYQAEGRGQNTVLATQFSAFSFKESLRLSKKDYRKIFSIACVMVALCAGVVVFFAFLPKPVIFLHNHAPIVLHIVDFVVQLLFWFWACIVVSLPVILILHSLLHYGVKKTVKRLEIFS
ncbi:hypothetical protein [Bartonella sp. OT172YNZD]|uniref:hypothetical protein n=1 Tax=Bartonella sp. OT172YNZD TaxID=3243572 RepID=UPI0035D0C740